MDPLFIKWATCLKRLRTRALWFSPDIRNEIMDKKLDWSDKHFVKTLLMLQFSLFMKQLM